VKQTAKGERADGTKIENSYTAKYRGEEVMLSGTGIAWDMTGVKQVNANTFTEERWRRWAGSTKPRPEASFQRTARR